ncbi:MAG: hypothetical protein AAF587_18600 [Bacteroidota bacterium]
MSISPGFIPASVIHDTSIPPAPSKKEVSLRHLFLRQLFSEISGFHYTLLSHFFRSPYELGFQSELQFLVDRNELEDWELHCRYSPYVQSCAVEVDVFHASYSIGFTDGTEVKLQFVLSVDAGHESLVRLEQILQHTYINRHGIKVSSSSSMFAYWFVQYCLQDKSLPLDYQLFFTSLSLKDRYAILELMQEEYGLPMKNLGQAFLLPTSFKEALICQTHQSEDQSFSNWVRTSWNYLSSIPETIFSKKSA